MSAPFAFPFPPGAISQVTNILSLSSSGLVDGNMIQASGRATAGDGGGGLFRYSASSTATADNGMVFVPSSGPGRFLREGYSANGTQSRVNLLWFGADPSGVANSLTAATASQAATTGRVYVPPGTYNLSGNAPGDWEVDDGVTFNGAGKFVANGSNQTYPLILNRTTGLLGPDQTHKHTINGTVDTANGNTLVSWEVAVNNGPQTGYGWRRGYTSYAYGASNFDLAEGVICEWERQTVGASGGTGMTNWRVAISPTQSDPSCNHRTVIAEWNVVNRSIDTGWLDRRSAVNQTSGFLQVVPEAKDFTGTGGTPKNVLFGLVFTNAPQSAETDALGYRPRMYTPLLGEPNSVHETGRAIYWSGSDGTGGTGGGAPVAFAQIAAAWQYGYKTNTATFTYYPVALGGGQYCAWLNGSDVLLGLEGFDANGSYLLGTAPTAVGVSGSRVWAATSANKAGDKQTRSIHLWRSVANPSGVNLTTTGGADTAANKLILQAGSAARIRGSIVATSGTPAAAGWDVTALVRRSAGTAVTIVSQTITKDTSDASTADWAIALAADNTNGGMSVTITGTGSFTVFADMTVVEYVR